jgi:hypothetical protein
LFHEKDSHIIAFVIDDYSTDILRRIGPGSTGTDNSGGVFA